MTYELHIYGSLEEIKSSTPQYEQSHISKKNTKNTIKYQYGYANFQQIQAEVRNFSLAE